MASQAKNDGVEGPSFNQNQRPSTLTRVQGVHTVRVKRRRDESPLQHIVLASEEGVDEPRSKRVHTEGREAKVDQKEIKPQNQHKDNTQVSSCAGCSTFAEAATIPQINQTSTTQHNTQPHARVFRLHRTSTRNESAAELQRNFHITKHVAPKVLGDQSAKGRSHREDLTVTFHRRLRVLRVSAARGTGFVVDLESSSKTKPPTVKGASPSDITITRTQEIKPQQGRRKLPSKTWLRRPEKGGLAGVAEMIARPITESEKESLRMLAAQYSNTAASATSYTSTDIPIQEEDEHTHGMEDDVHVYDVYHVVSNEEIADVNHILAPTVVIAESDFPDFVPEGNPEAIARDVCGDDDQDSQASDNPAFDYPEDDDDDEDEEDEDTDRDNVSDEENAPMVYNSDDDDALGDVSDDGETVQRVMHASPYYTSYTNSRHPKIPMPPTAMPVSAYAADGMCEYSMDMDEGVGVGASGVEMPSWVMKAVDDMMMEDLLGPLKTDFE